MKCIRVSELLSVDSLLIECIRIWIKYMVYDRNPLPILEKMMHTYGIKENVILFDEFMGCIALSSVKKYDFKITNCKFVGDSEKDILSLFYNFQNNNLKRASYYISELINQNFHEYAFKRSKIISKKLLQSGLFLENPMSYPQKYNNNNLIIIDFKNRHHYFIN